MSNRPLSTANSVNSGDKFSLACGPRGEPRLASGQNFQKAHGEGMSALIRPLTESPAETSPSPSVSPRPNNADIRPFISIGEAAELALSTIAHAKKEADGQD